MSTAMVDDWKLIELRGGEERRVSGAEFEATVQHLAGLLRAEGLAPYCSTEFANIAARRAIERAGFRANHRVLRVGFGD